MLKVATTENAARPFCIIDTASKTYIRKPNGNILTFKTRDDAQKAADARN